MKGQKTLHIRISGRRENQPLRPGLLDVDEWIKTLSIDAERIGFIDRQGISESADDYLDRLIEEATPHWEAAGDLDKWLKEVRGYE